MSAGVAVGVAIPEEKLVRVLVIDDNEGFQQDMKDYFALFSYHVDIANTPDEANVLRRLHEYQIVLVDVNFPGIDLKGDKYVLDNYKDFKGARMVVVTALEANELRLNKALESLKIPVWSKGDQEWGKKLTGLTKATANARPREIGVELNTFLEQKFGDGSYVLTSSSRGTAAAMAKAALAPWEVAVENMLIEWLESLSDRDRPFFSIGRTMLSANAMMEQVKQKTDFGKELLDMFVTEARQSLRLKNKSSL